MHKSITCQKFDLVASLFKKKKLSFKKIALSFKNLLKNCRRPRNSQENVRCERRSGVKRGATRDRVVLASTLPARREEEREGGADTPGVSEGVARTTGARVVDTAVNHAEGRVRLSAPLNCPSEPGVQCASPMSY